MATDAAVLALDVGTSSCRASLYDVRGRLLKDRFAQIAYTPTVSADGGAELDPNLLFDQVCAVADRVLHNNPPEILPGWNLRLNVHSDGQGYDLLLTDMTDEKCGYAVLTDENGVIRQSKAIDCEI